MLAAIPLLALIGTAIASPVPRAAAAWNDPYIKQPLDFELRQIDGCSYQLTFRRDSVDSRYIYSFKASYPSGATATLSPLSDSSNLAISRAGPTGTIPPYTLDFAPYTLSVLPFNDACSGGEQPSSLIAQARLPSGGYTYSNDWDSPAIAPIDDGPAPAVPSNVRAVGASGSEGRTAAWDAVQGATGYFVLSQYPTYASELGTDIPAYETREVGAEVLFTPIRSRASRLAVVAKAGNYKLSDVRAVQTVGV